MKKIIKFFNRIFNFFDRYIIMPITRLVYKVSKKFNVPNKKFESWLSRPTTLLFISLFLAIVVFIIVDRKIITFSSDLNIILYFIKSFFFNHYHLYNCEYLSTYDVNIFCLLSYL